MADFAPTYFERNSIEIAGETLVEEKAIGRKIRSLRLKHAMGQVELGAKVGLSASFLSQLETGKVVPTLRNLARISLVLGEDLSFFFRVDNRNVFRISRAKERVRLPVKERNAPVLVSESLSALIPDRSIVPDLTDFSPGVEGVTLRPPEFRGLECVFVLHGCLAVLINEGKFLLEAADVLWIDGAAKRGYRCHGKNPTKALMISMPTLSIHQCKRHPKRSIPGPH